MFTRSTKCLLLKIEYSILIGHLCTSTTCTFKLLISYGSFIHFSITLFWFYILCLYRGFLFLWHRNGENVQLILFVSVYFCDLKTSNTGYNFCALNILRYKSDSKKKVKIRSSWKLPGINGISSEWLSK